MFKIPIRPPDGSTKYIKVELSTTIKELKEKIEKKTGILANIQQLYYGVELSDSQTIDECGIHSNINGVHLVIKKIGLLDVEHVPPHQEQEQKQDKNKNEDTPKRPGCTIC